MKKASEQGQSLVELALSLAFLLILLSGIVDLGRVYFTYVALRDAAQEGAAYAAISPADSTGIVNRVRTTSSRPVDLTDTAHVQVAVTPLAGLCRGDAIEVKVTYDRYPLIMPFTGVFLGRSDLTLDAIQMETILRASC